MPPRLSRPSFLMRDSANGKKCKSLGTPRSVVRARDGAARNQHDSGRRKRSSASTRAFCSTVPSKAGFRFVGHDRQTTRLQPARQVLLPNSGLPRRWSCGTQIAAIAAPHPEVSAPLPGATSNRTPQEPASGIRDRASVSPDPRFVQHRLMLRCSATVVLQRASQLP